MSPALARQEEQNQGQVPQLDAPHSRQGNYETIDFLEEIKARELPKLRYNSNQPAWTGL
jgi:hypothetical protein